jgi:hypothetical protein
MIMIEFETIDHKKVFIELEAIWAISQQDKKGDELIESWRVDTLFDMKYFVTKKTALNIVHIKSLDTLIKPPPHFEISLEDNEESGLSSEVETDDDDEGLEEWQDHPDKWKK